MEDDATEERGDRLTRSAFWASAAFYVLVAFEFIYMATPFAAYVYSAYVPGLNLVGDSPTASWLVSFFLPHIVAQTTSPLVNMHKAVGAVLAIAGLCGFAVGAFQIYSNKLQKREMVRGGIYRWIRHPQYLALMIAGFGLMILWPRFLVLFGFVTVVFAYVLLARSEERLCSRQFTGYAEYAQGTGMFLPRTLEAPFRLFPTLRSKIFRIVIWILLYLAALVLAAFAGGAVQTHTVDHLYPPFPR